MHRLFRPYATATLLLVGLALLRQPAGAADWPQYRGLHRSGVAVEENPLDQWSEGGPTELWRRDIGEGFSAVSVVDDRLFTMESIDLEEAVLAIDRETGQTVWRTVVGHTDSELFPGTGPRSTPTVVDGTLFTVSSQSRLLAMSAASGEILWDRQLTEYGPTPRFGYSMSPLVDGDNVLVLVGDSGKQPGIISFDRASGSVRWQALDGPAGYSSPIVVDLGGVPQYVFVTGRGITALSPEGEQLWFHETDPKAALPMPVFVPPDKIFVATADDTFGSMMIRVVHEDGTFSTEETWTERLMRNHFNTSVLVGDHLYGFDNATLRCLDAETGEKRWAKRGFGKGSLVAAGDLIYVLSDTGTLALVRANAAQYEEVGQVEVTEGRSWTAPSLAAGRLYIRDFDELVSLDLRSASGSTAVAAATAENDHGTLAKATFKPDGMTVDQVIAKHLTARGGADRWRTVEGLRLAGVYAAFSEESSFTEVRQRGDLYRLDFELLGGAAIRARGTDTAWWQHALLQAEAAPIGDHPYRAQLERESVFGPLLLDAKARGIEAELAGQSVINGVATIDLKVVLADGQQETWHLDSQTFLEVAVDSQIYDFTQFEDPTSQRAFFSDFREVDGLVIPFRVDTEFGARLEEMRVETVEIDPEIDAARFKAPPPPPAPPAAETEGDSGEGEAA